MEGPCGGLGSERGAAEGAGPEQAAEVGPVPTHGVQVSLDTAQAGREVVTPAPLGFGHHQVWLNTFRVLLLKVEVRTNRSLREQCVHAMHCWPGDSFL